MVTAKKPAVKRAPVKRVAKPAPVKNPDFTDKVVDLIKWVDSPFKLISVVLISFIAFAGYFAWDSRQVILGAISSKKTELKEPLLVEAISKSLIYDLSADVVIVNSVNLQSNSRTTILAMSNQGREKTLEGSINALFTSTPEHNRAVITMFQGEVHCEAFVPSSKLGEYAVKHGVTYMCRGAVPPEQGRFVGYIAVGFKIPPKDIIQAKTRINLASTEMSK
jgi:hypothetical protein